MSRLAATLAVALAAVLVAGGCTPPPGSSRDGDPSSTTAGPSAGAPGSAGGVLVLGDSVVIGASGALTSRLPGVEIDAVVSRQFSSGLDVARSRASSGRLGASTVVVHLGTNGTVTRSACDALLDLLAPRKVVVVNNAVPRSWEVGNNSTLASCAHRHGAAYADWKTVTLAGGLLASDGVHLTAAGRESFADLVAANVTS
jgi:hypothetical protein